MTVATVPDVESAFDAALRKDAAVSPPEYPPPPRQQVSADPAAPHGRDDAGEPLAPHGINKKTGRPNLKPAGPGRGHKGDEPRVKTPGKADVATTAAKPGSGRQAAAGVDYSEDLAGLGYSVWMVASAFQGGKVPLIKLKVPDLRPYAFVWHEQLPQGVAVWNQAAQQNAAVRGFVEKYAGEGSWQWVIGAGIWGANFLAGCQQMAGKDKDSEALRETAARLNDQEMKTFLGAQMAAAEAAAGPLPDGAMSMPATSA